MKERPISFKDEILFKDEMVLAILEGRKTQTRRVLKPQPYLCLNKEQWKTRALSGVESYMRPLGSAVLEDLLLKCPYGQPGDRLWVREAHWWFKDERDPVTGYFPPALTAEDVEYRADGDDGRKVWRPSIHMPRWASRIKLEITNVRVEKLQQISEADAIAEGCDNSTTRAAKTVGWYEKPIRAFRRLWESIYDPESWDANPWVWVIEFKRVNP